MEKINTRQAANDGIQVSNSLHRLPALVKKTTSIVGLLALAGFSRAADPPLPLAEPSPKDAYRQALLIGVWDYKSPTDKLGSFEANLTTLEQTFRDLDFNEVLPPLRNPTAGEIINSVQKIAVTAAAMEAERSTLTVIYFIGHGTMVNHDAYLLGSDFHPPAHPSDITEYGGVGIDFLADELGKTGQPALLIVEACRNPLSIDPNALPPADAPIDAARMIAGPSRFHSGHAVLYAQEPGGLVELIRNDLQKPTPFAEALARLARESNEITALSSKVSVGVTNTTAQQRYPTKPQLVHGRGSGHRYLRYNDLERALDTFYWNQSRDAGSYQEFFAAYATSPFVPVAKWLEQRRAKAEERPQSFIAYSGEVQGLLGRGPRIFGDNLDKTKSDYAFRTEDGVRFAEYELASVRRTDDSERLEGRTLSGETVTFAKTKLPRRFDASKIPDFWQLGGVEAIACTPFEILNGGCALLESAAATAVAGTSAETGSVFVASIIDNSAESTGIDTTIERINAVRLRLRALGAENHVVFRNFYRYELPNAAGSLLLKRGDGATF